MNQPLCSAAGFVHVPNNIHRTIDGIPLRLTYIRKIFNALSSTHCGDTDLSIEDIGDYVKFIETHCRSFLSKQDNMDDIGTLTKKENIPFNRFLTPPIRTCLRCQKLLTMQNYPAKVKIFTTDGPIRALKFRWSAEIVLACMGFAISLTNWELIFILRK
jgi:hypothetical protein